MALSHKQLLGLGVETCSGASLGKVLGFTIDSLSQKILTYEVGEGLVVVKINYVIHRHQVLSLSEEKMVVDDAVVKEEIPIKAEEFSEEQSSAV